MLHAPIVEICKMTKQSASVHPKMHQHVVRYANEWTQAGKPQRKPFNASVASNAEEDNLEEAINFVTPPDGAGGAAGKFVDNSFEKPNGVVANLTQSKSKHYLVDAKDGSLPRSASCHIPRLAQQGKSEIDEYRYNMFRRD